MSSLEGKNVLITGGAGYLASGLVAQLMERECRIVRIGRAKPFPEPPGGCAIVGDLVADVCDPLIWGECLAGTDLVFHFAAQTSTYVANADPLADQRINVLPMLRMLEACRQLGTQPTVCFASTVTVAGIPQALPVAEEHPDHPLTAYDLHKQMAEAYLRWYAEQGWVRGVTLRLANVYGPGPRSSREDRGVLNLMMQRAVRGEPLTVYGAGEQLRDYLYIEDAARAFISAAEHANKLTEAYYVIGSGVGHSIVETLEMVAARAEAQTGRPVEIRHVAPPGDLSPIEQRNFVADSRKFSQQTGWKPRYALESGITRTLEGLL